MRDQYTVSIGGILLTPAEISFAGLGANSVSALYQFDVKVPDGVRDGNAEVVVMMGGQRTQDGAYIPVRR
ncbi:MAG: hypothetical protein NTY38_32090 [Acidobacteria bacterium]|nr:hypothetical protein [Acidobacteriota bacterium]